MPASSRPPAVPARHVAATPAILAALSLLAAAGCASKKSEAAAPPVAPAPGNEAPPATPTVAAVDARPATVVLELVGVGDGRDYVLDAPAGSSATVDEGGDERLPEARIKVGAFWISVDSPEGGHVPFAEARVPADGERIEHAVAEADGYTVIASGLEAGATRYWTMVDRVALDVRCFSEGLASRADADTVATICHSIRESK